ncbi:MAG: hypothetical protein M3O67_08920 [Bacteroidota bacterium]|nr:hypothetical protein [Bacteroidota bacterium]
MTEINKLYQQLLQPSDELVSEIKMLDGDILILGVGGKMGPALARLAKQAIDKAGIKKIVIGVSRLLRVALPEFMKYYAGRGYWKAGGV